MLLIHGLTDTGITVVCQALARMAAGSGAEPQLLALIMQPKQADAVWCASIQLVNANGLIRQHVLH